MGGGREGRRMGCEFLYLHKKIKQKVNKNAQIKISEIHNVKKRGMDGRSDGKEWRKRKTETGRKNKIGRPIKKKKKKFFNPLEKY